MAPTSEFGTNRAGPVATVTLCRPDVLNAQTPAMWTELDAISRKLPGDVRVVIVRGEGRAFSAGLDLSVARGRRRILARRTGAVVPGRVRRTHCRVPGRVSPGCARPSLVTIAAVQGHAIGAGFQLALDCDMRVLADDAQFSMAEVTLGLVPDLGGTKRLIELVGQARALEICRHRPPDRRRRGGPDRSRHRRRAGRRARRRGRRTWPPRCWPARRARSPRSRPCSPARPAVPTPTRTVPSGRRRPAGCGTWPASVSNGCSGIVPLTGEVVIPAGHTWLPVRGR